MHSSYRFVVSGSVQGVGFRVATRRKALALGLHGWVRNHPEGHVEGMATGVEETLAAFRRWLAEGPPSARVTRVDWTASAPEPEAGPGFHIHR